MYNTNIIYKTKNYIAVLFSIFPVSILFGNFLINSTIILISSLFIIRLIKNKSDFFNEKGNNYLLLLLLFFFGSLLINLIFTNNISLSYQRVCKFFFIIFFILSFKFLTIYHYKNVEKIYIFWSLIFLIVLFDLIFEFFSGKNILGFNSIMPGRLGSFTGEESVIGNFFFGFSLIFLSFAYTKSKSFFFNIFLAFTLIVISFIIGERANFIKTFFAIVIFIIIIYKISYKVKFLSIVFCSVIICLIYLNSNSDYKWRYFDQIELLFKKNGLIEYLDNSQYGAHRNVAKEIFFKNPIFGVGIKNFRIESAKKIYDNLDHKQNHLRISNHPHELYYEFLSETGIFGLTCFLVFILASIIISIRNYLINKNIYQFSGIVIVSLSILPIIPTGAFFSTYNSSIFWINYAIMVSYFNIKRSDKKI